VYPIRKRKIASSFEIHKFRRVKVKTVANRGEQRFGNGYLKNKQLLASQTRYDTIKRDNKPGEDIFIKYK